MQTFDATNSVTQIQSQLQLQEGSTAWDVVYTVWNSYVDKAQIYPRLQFYYTIVQIIDMLLAGTVNAVNYREESVSEELTDITVNYRAMRVDMEKERMLLETRARSNRTINIDQITQKAPWQKPDGYRPNANDSEYSGNPYKDSYGWIEYGTGDTPSEGG